MVIGAKQCDTYTKKKKNIVLKIKADSYTYFYTCTEFWLCVSTSTQAYRDATGPNKCYIHVTITLI